MSPVRTIPFRHGSSRALIQDLLFLGLPPWKCNFAEVDVEIQAYCSAVFWSTRALETTRAPGAMPLSTS